MRHRLPCESVVASGLALLLLSSATLAGAETPPNSHAATPVSDAGEPTAEASIENSVVKIFSTVQYPDVFRPWSKQPPQEVTGSGVVIEGNRILTNAHVVFWARQVQIQANQSGQKLNATVSAIAPGIDLAVLTLDDDSFFETHAALARASKLPDIKDTVLAYGYPTGGSSLSITQGIVSRIEFTQYNFPTSGLRVQVDAAINPGNSGGPMIESDRMIGLVFSVLGGAQNIGYIIPNEEIELFLADIADGHYDAKPGFFDEWQKLQNPHLRAYLKLPPKTQGVVVHSVFEDSTDYPLKPWDVITKVGDAAVDDEGMVNIGPNLRVRFDYEIQRAVRDGKVAMTVVRDGKEATLDVPVSADRPVLVPDIADDYPPYFVYGPITFSIATSQMFGAFNHDSINGLIGIGSPLISRRFDKPAFEGEQLVVVPAPFFPHPLAQGYWSPNGWVVKSVDGIRIKNLRHLVEVLRDGRDEDVVFEFYGRGMETFVFPRAAMVEATEGVLSDNGLRAQGSPELLKVWNENSDTEAAAGE